MSLPEGDVSAEAKFGSLPEEHEGRAALTFREKHLWWEFGSAAAVLVLFGLSSWLHPVAGGWSNTLLVWLWLGPQMYWLSKLHSGDMLPPDERDREIDAKGDLSGLKVLGFGVALLVAYLPLFRLYQRVTVTELTGAMFVLLCLAQMVRVARKLRLYAGYEYLMLNRWSARNSARSWRRMAERVGSTEVRERWLAMAEEWEEKARR